MKKDKPRKWHPILVGTMVCILIAIAAVGGGYIIVNQQLSADDFESVEATKEYIGVVAFVVPNVEDSYWSNVLVQTKEAGEQANVLVEDMASDMTEQFTVKELLQIAIAADVDGILLNAGGEDVETELNQAKKAGIPVVTMLESSGTSAESCFVGVNSYDLGTAYGEAVKKVVTQNHNEILILLNSQNKTEEQKTIISGISKSLMGTKVKIKTKPIGMNDQFETEKYIRDILLDNKKRPDIILCLSASDTIYACQSLIDYNQVGVVDVIGSYANDEIEDGLKKGIIASVVTVSPQTLGTKAIEALLERKNKGTTNEYQTIPCKVLTGEEAADE